LPTFTGRLILKITAVSGDPINSNWRSMALAGVHDNFTLVNGSESRAINRDARLEDLDHAASLLVRHLY
jgi:hypothetical protein